MFGQKINSLNLKKEKMVFVILTLMLLVQFVCLVKAIEHYKTEQHNLIIHKGRVFEL